MDRSYSALDTLDSQDTEPAAPTLSAFERLPLEIRHQIYGELDFPAPASRAAYMPCDAGRSVLVRLTSTFPYPKDSIGHRRMPFMTKSAVKIPTGLGLMGASRRFAADLYELMYAENWMTFEWDVTAIHG